MKKIKSGRYLILLVVVMLLTGTGIYITQYKNQYETLTAENEQLIQENNKLEAQRDYLQTSTVESEDTGYYKWPEIVRKADVLVEESDEEFKMSWALYLVKEAERYNIDPYLVYELLKVETGGTFNPELVGPDTVYGNAYGMSQFMKNTAPWIAEMGELPYEDDLLFDPYYSIQLSLIYLDFLHNEYGNWNEALTAYHRGMAGLEQYKEENGHAKSDYAKRIQNNAEEYKSLALN
ncbi:transglycosylase SLT domain-containing protein [Aquibacillus halophilus]|uniref:Transglycosylase SLT domain-containing protein n=1 Tax=Aquibacillus halophilus TaxID=930132 RepID=A0A6A8DBL0_9BACI|nr:transglycosylase SLT domain-containing protein [Aquibacillus halophilus]MRH43105.1 transglycosylase SLT domain-containing protein [Aquibacillus halophilus]